jgi:hypothetical protein
LGLHYLQRCWKTCTSRRKYEFLEVYKCEGSVVAKEEWECGCLFSTGWSVRRHGMARCPPVVSNFP